MATHALAQQAPPEEVAISHVIQGNVVAGTIIKTRRHLAYSDGRVRMNPSIPSAMVPAIVDVTRLPSSVRHQVESDCSAVSITRAGCELVMRGEVREIEGRPGLVATGLDILIKVRARSREPASD